MANSEDTYQTSPLGAVCSGSTLFASIPNSSAMLGNSLQQTTSADDIFRCIFSWRFKDCLVLNPITVYSYGFLFNCTTMGQDSDSMTALT